MQGHFETRVKEYLFANTMKRTLINDKKGSNVLFQRFEFLRTHFSLSRSLENLRENEQLCFT